MRREVQDVHSMVCWSREEVMRTEPDGEDLDCHKKELIFYPLGNGQSSRTFEQGYVIIRSLDKINLSTICIPEMHGSTVMQMKLFLITLFKISFLPTCY